MAENSSGAQDSTGGGPLPQSGNPDAKPLQRFLFGEFELQAGTGLLLRKGHRVRIQDLPFRLLVILLERRGEVVSREELRNSLWGEKTFVEFDNNLRVAAAKLREALDDSAASPRYLETVARRGYRFLAPIEIIEPPPSVEPMRDAEVLPSAPPASPPSDVESSQKNTGTSWLVMGLVVVLLAVGFGIYRWKFRPVLKTGDIVALGAVQNATGDASLNDSLSLGFIIKMEESPFLHAIPSELFEKTTLRIQKSSDGKLERSAAELKACSTAGANLLLRGTLKRSGSGFNVLLVALRCKDGGKVASTEAHADSVPSLLKALDSASDNLRLRLGETHAMLGRFDVPLTQATTDSLAAQRAFRTGEQLHMTGRDLDAVESYKLAIDLDPRFAMAYMQLGRMYANVGEPSLSRSYLQKAFDLRERTTDREKLHIATSYYSEGTGEIDRAIGAYQLWQSLYPKDVVPVNNLATLYNELGQSDKAIVEARKAIELEPLLPVPYATLSQALMRAGDYSTLAVLCNDHAGGASTTMLLPLVCHELALATGDTNRQLEIEQAAHGTPLEAYLANDTAEAAAYSGHLHRAEEIFALSVTKAREHGLAELASDQELNGVAILAAMGDRNGGPAAIDDAIAHSAAGGDTLMGAAMAWAILGNESKARFFIDKAVAQEPTNLLLVKAEIPVAFAAAQLNSGHAREALQQLELTRAYDDTEIMELMGPYYRGLALEQTGDIHGAQAEFERMVAHRAVRPRSVFLALGVLELAKLYAANGETAKATPLVAELRQSWAAADPGFVPLRTLNTAFPPR